MSALLVVVALLWLTGIAALGYALDAPRRARRRENTRLLRAALRDLERGGQGVPGRSA